MADTIMADVSAMATPVAAPVYLPATPSLQGIPVELKIHILEHMETEGGRFDCAAYGGLASVSHFWYNLVTWRYSHLHLRLDNWSADQIEELVQYIADGHPGVGAVESFACQVKKVTIREEDATRAFAGYKPKPIFKQKRDAVLDRLFSSLPSTSQQEADQRDELRDDYAYSLSHRNGVDGELAVLALCLPNLEDLSVNLSSIPAEHISFARLVLLRLQGGSSLGTANGFDNLTTLDITLSPQDEELQYPQQLLHLTVRCASLDGDHLLSLRPALPSASALTSLTLSDFAVGLERVNSLIRAGHVPHLEYLAIHHPVYDPNGVEALLHGLRDELANRIRVIHVDGCWRDNDYDNLEDELLAATPLPEDSLAGLNALAECSLWRYYVLPPHCNRPLQHLSTLAQRAPQVQRFTVTGLYPEDFREMEAHEGCAVASEWPAATTTLGLYLDFDVHTGTDLYERTRPIHALLDQVRQKAAERTPAIEVAIRLRATGDLTEAWEAYPRA